MITEPTKQLRFLRVKIEKGWKVVLQQLWIDGNGQPDWRDVPIVEDGAPLKELDKDWLKSGKKGENDLDYKKAYDRNEAILHRVAEHVKATEWESCNVCMHNIRMLLQNYQYLEKDEEE